MKKLSPLNIKHEKGVRALTKKIKVFESSGFVLI